MQLQTAYFVLVPPLGELNKTCFVFDSGLFAPLCENMTSSTKPEVHKIFDYRQEADRATATGNMYRKFGEIWTCGCCDMRADRQTDKLITILPSIRTNTGGEVKIVQNVVCSYGCVMLCLICKKVVQEQLTSPLYGCELLWSSCLYISVCISLKTTCPNFRICSVHVTYETIQ